MIRTPHASAGRARRPRHVRAARVARTHGPRGRTRRLPKASHALTVRMRRAGTFPCSSAHRLSRLLSPFSPLLSPLSSSSPGGRAFVARGFSPWKPAPPSTPLSPLSPPPRSRGAAAAPPMRPETIQPSRSAARGRGVRNKENRQWKSLDGPLRACYHTGWRRTAFRIPHSAFRIPHSAFRIPHSAFRIPRARLWALPAAMPWAPEASSAVVCVSP
jgi:hypothetical protein